MSYRSLTSQSTGSRHNFQPASPLLHRSRTSPRSIHGPAIPQSNLSNNNPLQAPRYHPPPLPNRSNLNHALRLGSSQISKRSLLRRRAPRPLLRRTTPQDHHALERHRRHGSNRLRNRASRRRRLAIPPLPPQRRRGVRTARRFGIV